MEISSATTTNGLKGILVNSSNGPLLYLRSLEDVEVQ